MSKYTIDLSLYPDCIPNRTHHKLEAFPKKVE